MSWGCLSQLGSSLLLFVFWSYSSTTGNLSTHGTYEHLWELTPFIAHDSKGREILFVLLSITKSLGTTFTGPKEWKGNIIDNHTRIHSWGRDKWVLSRQKWQVSTTDSHGIWRAELHRDWKIVRQPFSLWSVSRMTSALISASLWASVPLSFLQKCLFLENSCFWLPVTSASI